MFKFGDKVKPSKQVLDEHPTFIKYVGIVLYKNAEYKFSTVWTVYWNKPYGIDGDVLQKHNCQIQEWALELVIE